MDNFFMLFSLFSLLLMIPLGIFCYKLVRKLFDVTENLNSFIENVEVIYYSIDEFNSHLQHFNTLPSYSGEPVIAGLIEHSKEVMEDIDNFVGNLPENAKEEKEK
tara:strand:- start:138 stop:452 length:315 start_codon:yes stop_codon:yes gene_type:complete